MRVTAGAGKTGEAVRKTYGTFRNDLIRMRIWLKQLQGHRNRDGIDRGVLAPALECLEEEGFAAAAGQSGAGEGSAGRKSDSRDARRIAEFLQDGGWTPVSFLHRRSGNCGMMLRHRIALLEQRNEVHNQIRDLFETAGLKLSSGGKRLIRCFGPAASSKR